MQMQTKDKVELRPLCWLMGVHPREISLLKTKAKLKPKRHPASKGNLSQSEFWRSGYTIWYI